MTQKHLEDSELNKVTGGTTVSGFGFYGDDVHILRYSNNSGSLRLTILEMKENGSTPFHIKSEYMYSNGRVYNTADSWWTLSDVNYFWNKSTLG